jgi:hypothetical protein
MITMSRAMPRSPLLFRRWIIGLLWLALAGLPGCSALRLGYNQAPELVYWWLDGYVDFDAAQAPRVRDALASWFEWHRRTQLPDYAALLARAQRDVLADTTPERACAWWAEVQRRADAAFDQALVQAADSAATLTPQQLEHIERRQAKSNDEFRDEHLTADAAERRDKAVKRVVERAETLYGRLDETQRERVARTLANSPFDPELWLSERIRRHQDALEVLRSVTANASSRPKTLAALQGWADRLRHSPRPDYRRYSEQLTQFNCTFSAALHNRTSPAQRQAAAERLKGWETDLRALAASNGGGR